MGQDRATGPGGLAPLDSGLAIFSDYPILDTRRMVFPAGLCAGYDCLAAKGAMTARIAVPGVEQPVEIVTTHLNSAKSSRAPVELRDRIHAGQLAAIDAFVEERYASWNGPLGRRIMGGETTLTELRDEAERLGEVPLESGRQEMLENMFNRFI